MPNLNKKTVLCIFAHPDDESFGPGGTIAQLSQKYEIYSICVTDGNSPDKKENLRKIRRQELQSAAQVLGIKKVFFLDYPDGSLNNMQYHQIANQVDNILKQINPWLMITYEPRGVSGHLDHIAVSMISSYVFTRNKKVKELWYFCLPNSSELTRQDYFVYFPPGYEEGQIDKTVDVSRKWETKLKAIVKHQSQQKDIDNLTNELKNRPKKEHFIILKQPK